MTREGIVRILLGIVSALLFCAVLWRAGMGVSMDRIRTSSDSVSNEFLPIDEVVMLVDEHVSATGSVAYVVEDVDKLDGLDRATFAAVAFRVLPRRLLLVDYNCENLYADYVLIGNYSSERNRLVGQKTGYVEVGRTRSTTLFAKSFKSAEEPRKANDKAGLWAKVRQSAVAVLLVVLVCALFMRLSGVNLNFNAAWWCAFVSVAIVLALGCLLTHTLRSPNGTAVYAGKAKLLYLAGCLPDDFFVHDDWRVFLPVYPIGLTILTLIYYFIAGGCDNWMVQLLAFAGVLAASLLVFGSFRTRVGRLLALLFLVSVGTKQIAAGFYPEGFVAASILAAMIRLRSGRGDIVAWGTAGVAAIFKNEGLVLYAMLYCALRMCGMRHLCRPFCVIAGFAPAVAWFVLARMLGGSLDGYALNGIQESLLHLWIALKEALSCMARDWKGGIATIPIFVVCCVVERVLMRQKAKGFLQVVTRLALMSLIGLPIVYCFCSAFQIRWRIHSSCFRLLWPTAALSLYGMSMMEHRLLAVLRSGKCALRT